MKTKISIVAFLILTVLVISCRKPSKHSTDDVSDTPILPSTPYDYESSGNDHLATAGRVLFYDKNLSLNGSVSCASCHQQSKAFCDNLQFSPGLENNNTARNTPGVFAKTGRMFWDGRATTIADLVLRPIKNHVEMKFDNLSALADRLSKISYYQDLFTNAFGDNAIDSTRIQMALAEFVRNFNFSSNKFKRSLLKQEKLTASESLGKLIFFGKGHCSECHHIEDPFPGGNGYGFTNTEFNIGLDQVYADNGVGAISNQPTDAGKFMVPVLLNIEYTSPYMHDGRFKTLEEVVEHYNSGIKNHPNLDLNLRDLSSLENLTDPQIMQLLDANHNDSLEQAEILALPPVKLGLTTIEKKGLVDFLKTLSDPSIFTEKKFSDPFKK
jgi:cytochrome c peroxidase